MPKRPLFMLNGPHRKAPVRSKYSATGVADTRLPLLASVETCRV